MALLFEKNTDGMDDDVRSSSRSRSTKWIRVKQIQRCLGSYTRIFLRAACSLCHSRSSSSCCCALVCLAASGLRSLWSATAAARRRRRVPGPDTPLPPPSPCLLALSACAASSCASPSAQPSAPPPKPTPRRCRTCADPAQAPSCPWERNAGRRDLIFAIDFPPPAFNSQKTMVNQWERWRARSGPRSGSNGLWLKP